MWRQVRQLKKARRLSGAVMATLRKRRRSDDSAPSGGEPDSLPRDGGTAAAAGSDTDGDSDGDAADAELVAEFEQHQCVTQACRLAPDTFQFGRQYTTVRIVIMCHRLWQLYRRDSAATWACKD